MIPQTASLLLALAALAFVLALIWLAQSVLRRIGPRPAAGRRLAVQEAIALDPRRRLHLVSCDGRQVLLLTGGGQDLVVGWIEPPR